MSHEDLSNSVRTEVFEIIVQQALEGSNWEEICAGPMLVNKISADEVKAEVARRKSLTEIPSPQPSGAPNVIEKLTSEIPVSGTRSFLVVILLLLLFATLALSITKWMHGS